MLCGVRDYEWGIAIPKDVLSKAGEEIPVGRLNAHGKCQRHPAGSANEEQRMSYLQNGNHDHMNGNYGGEGSDGPDENIQDTTPRETSRARRAGGYGGLMSDDLPLPTDHDEPFQWRQRGSEGASNGINTHGSPGRRGIRHDGRRQSKERDGSSASNARIFGNGPGGSQIQGQITTQWLTRRREIS